MSIGAELHAIISLLGMLFLNPRSGLLIGLLAVAAWIDWRTLRIPNVLIFGGATLGLMVNALMPVPREVEFLSAMAGLATGLALLLPFYAVRAMGAADVKLMAMVGVFLGFPATLYAGLATLLVGGVLALAHATAGKLPYGLAIAGGTIGYLVSLQLGLL